MKIVYIAHPIGGDVDNNVKKVLEIVKHINLSYPKVTPFAPYIVDVLALNEANPEERKRGFKNNKALFESRIIDQVWLYGERVSGGMEIEIDWAKSLGIPVISMSDGTRNFDK